MENGDIKHKYICDHRKFIVSDIIKKRDGTSYKYTVCESCGFRNLIELHPKTSCVIS